MRTVRLESQARLKLRSIVRKARALPALRRRCPARSWEVDVAFVGAPEMKQLNSHYRGKRYATDILSFEAPSAFRKQGLLGELVICGPVLRRQAREQGHAMSRELEVLLAHGVLHLLGFDHEKGARQAREMAQWEARLLGRGAEKGLISRST